jgi:pimeloyl-ACP methyl ester carboxylesterase
MDARSATLRLSTALGAMLICGSGAQAGEPGSQTFASGLQSDVVFTEYTPLSDITELVRRSLSPLQALAITQEAQRNGKTLRGQPIDLAHEHFSVYVPAASVTPPSSGYSLLVFVPSWPQAEVPHQWIPALNRHHMILVTAANSGNEASVIDRREPLALLAEHNVIARYPVDPQHVYVGGLSGGSRVALRLALAYPDVFHGALLNAGSDAVGNADVPLPPADLFARFQESTRLVYVTGERDNEGLVADLQSRESLEKWCVFNFVTETEPRMGHELADASAFARALDGLLTPAKPDPARLADCRARNDRELSAQLKQVADALAHGATDDTRRLLDKVDARYGGLAAPRSVELAGR